MQVFVEKCNQNGPHFSKNVNKQLTFFQECNQNSCNFSKMETKKLHFVKKVNKQLYFPQKTGNFDKSQPPKSRKTE